MTNTTTRITRSGKARNTTTVDDEQSRAKDFRRTIRNKRRRIRRSILDKENRNVKKYWLKEADRLERAVRKEEAECARKRARIAKCLKKVEAMDKGEKMEEDETGDINEAEHDGEEEFKQEDCDEEYYDYHKEEDDDDGNFP